MNLKSILLGTAAAVVAAPAAYAADMPMAPVVPVAVDYVKVCDTFSTGFFYIPGTDTCLRIGGRVRSTTVIGDDADDDIVFSNRLDARIDVDARTMTEYGALRTFIRIASASTNVFSDDGDGILDGNDFISDSGNAFFDLAFVQLGYITVGRTASIFDYDLGYGINDKPVFNDDVYQLSVLVDDLGGGFYVGAAIENQRDNDRFAAVFDDDALPAVTAVVGIGGQPWGGAEAGVYYDDENDLFVAKAGAMLEFGAFGANIGVGYVDLDGDDGVYVGGGVIYNVSDAFRAYASARYDFQDGDDGFTINGGVEYDVVRGLTTVAEVNYYDDGDDDDFAGYLRLVRNF